MKQLPGPKSGIIRVQMDEDELKRMLQPILEEVNSLRARVTELEAQSQNCLDDIVTLSADLMVVENWIGAHTDDGK